MTKRKIAWWKEGVIYQIYPRSFMDSDGDGVGDLRGITARLDYLVDLGIRSIWLSPFYPSPMADFGYDVSDYTEVDPLFGTMEDFELLLKEAHQRDLKLLVDLVPNHSSDEHPWFLESRKSKHNPKRDWYIWKDPAPGGGPPNNWLSVFGGSGWEFDPATGQYYYHAFHTKQPDLNWRNPQVQEAMLDVMRFWLEKGVDGFRVDVMWHMIKDDHFRDNPPNPEYREGQSPYDQHLPIYSTDQPEVHTMVRRMRHLVNAYDERLLIGEIYLPIHKLVAYYGEDEDSGAHLPFNFQLLQTPWEAKEIEAVINEYEASIPGHGWPNWVLGNHDISRIATRIGREQAKNAAILLLTLRGTPTLYYGDEIGMEDVKVPPGMARDPQELNLPGAGLGRDPERSPMQWDGSPFAGFSSTSTWLPLMSQYKVVNVRTQLHRNGSLLEHYRKLIRLRNKERTLQIGDHVPVFTENKLLSYIRQSQEKKYLVILNLGTEEQAFTPKLDWKGRVVIATDPGWEDKQTAGSLQLPGNLGLLIELL